MGIKNKKNSTKQNFASSKLAQKEFFDYIIRLKVQRFSIIFFFQFFDSSHFPISKHVIFLFQIWSIFSIRRSFIFRTREFDIS